MHFAMQRRPATPPLPPLPRLVRRCQSRRRNAWRCSLACQQLSSSAAQQLSSSAAQQLSSSAAQQLPSPPRSPHKHSRKQHPKWLSPADAFCHAEAPCDTPPPPPPPAGKEMPEPWALCLQMCTRDSSSTPPTPPHPTPLHTSTHIHTHTQAPSQMQQLGAVQLMCASVHCKVGVESDKQASHSLQRLRATAPLLPLPQLVRRCQSPRRNAMRCLHALPAAQQLSSPPPHTHTHTHTSNTWLTPS
jgi:hypothetical protein